MTENRNHNFPKQNSLIEGVDHLCVDEKTLENELIKKDREWNVLGDLPVPIERLAYAFGAKSVTYENMTVDGMLRPESDGFTILLNNNQSRGRIRFSCAHEIAHAILDPNVVACRGGVAVSGLTEKECEKVASMLLMPRIPFSRYLHTYGRSISAIVRLSSIFDTSIQATALRFVQLADEPCIAIVSAMKNGKTGRRLRVQWSAQSPRLYRSDGKPRYFIPRGKSISLETALTAYQSKQTQADVETLDVGSLVLTAYTESQRFDYLAYRYVLTLVFPSRTFTDTVVGKEPQNGV